MNTTNTRFNKYPAYKNSGVDWLGKIPEHWEVFPGLRIIYENKSKNIGLIRNTVLSLSYGNIRIKDESELTGLVPESFETYQLVEKGDLIFRPTDLQNDHVSLRSSISNFQGIITNAYLNFRFKNNANPKFYHYLFRTIDNNKIIYGLGSGLRQNISFGDFKRFNFPFPPLAEQTAIAQFLDDKTAKIDQAIAQKQKMMNLLKERKQIIIQDLVTGKKVWNAQQNAWTKPTEVKDSGVEWIGEIPKEWEVKRLKYIANIVLGKMICNQNLGGMQLKPYLKSKNIQWLKVDISSVDEMWFTKDEMKQYKLNQNDLILSEGGEVGKTCIWNNELSECFIQNSAHKVTFDKKNNPFFFLYLFNHIGKKGGFESIVNRVSIGHLTKDKLINLVTVLPKLNYQNIIVQEIESQSTKIDRAISLLEQEIEKLKEYKAVLIDSAVTGKMRIEN